MYNTLTRSNQLVSFAFSVMAVAIIWCALESVTRDYAVDVSIKTVRVSVKTIGAASANSKNLGVVSFDLKADFSSVFNWNVRQLFVYLTAEYPSKEFPFNQQVIWDQIITRNDEPVVDLTEAGAKYFFWDASELSESNENVTLSLSWNVIPESGFILDFEAPNRHVFNFPKAYVKVQK